MSDFLDPGRGPHQSGDFEVSPSLFILLFGLGFLIGAVGHLVRSRTLVATGVVLVLVATILLPVAYNVSN
jgi:hypothetical protein